MRKQSYFLTAAIAALMHAFVSCGGGDNYNFGETPSGTVSVTGISLNKTATTLAVGGSERLTHTIQPSNATNKNVSWSSSNNAVASVTTTGLVTAYAAGAARITVTTQDGGRAAYCDVTVSATSVAVTGVTLNKSATMLAVGGTEVLTAIIQPSNATNQNVTWSSNNNGAASVSNSGLVTAHAAGTARITATTQDGGRTAFCDVTVSATNVPVTGVSLNQTTMSLTAGGTGQLTAQVQPSSATNKNVSWSSSNNAVASVSSSGLVTAQSAGTARITATTQDGGRTAYCDVTVSAANVPVTGVSLNKSAATLTVGSTEQLTATIQPSNATNKAVSWETSNSALVTVNNGLLTAMAPGSATITVRTNDGNHTAACAVMVYPISVTGVSLNKNATTLGVGGAEQLTATIQPSNATNRAVTWETSSSAVATVSSGLVTAIASGSATITVRTNDGNYSATCAVTVTTPVTGVSLNKTTMTLTIGGAEQLTATIQPANATNQAIAWETSNSAVATVSSGLVTAIATGNAAITVRTLDGGHTATCFVTVNPTPVTGITLNKNAMTLIESGGSEQLTHTILPANASNQNVIWASSNTNIAIVSNGFVVAIAKGQA